MSSLAAAKADNFYFPPGFDPKKHGSLNKFQGQHPLRDRARKLATEGILVIRFEVPFNIWCLQCGEHVAKGVRFNAEKKQVGAYHSTKVWSFTMRHHCGCKITIETDPKNAEYVVTAGARRKVETYDAADAEAIEFADADERAAVAADPLASLERSTVQARRALEGRARVEALAADAAAKHADPYAANKRLRAGLRGERRAEARLDARRAELGLPEQVRLLPEAPGDATAARVALLQGGGARFEQAHAGKRKRVMQESIFGGASSSSGGGGGQSSRAAAAAAGAGRSKGGGGSGSMSSAAAQLAQRVKAAKLRQAAKAAGGGL